MNDNRSKQILDATFLHLEKAIEDMRRDRDTKKKKKIKVSEQKSIDVKINDSD